MLLNKSNIQNGNTVQPSDITQIIDALTYTGSYELLISSSVSIGSNQTSPNVKLYVNGTISGSNLIANSITASLNGDGSNITGVISSSYSANSSNSISSSYSNSANSAISSSYSDYSNKSKILSGSYGSIDETIGINGSRKIISINTNDEMCISSTNFLGRVYINYTSSQVANPAKSYTWFDGTNIGYSTFTLGDITLMSGSSSAGKLTAISASFTSDVHTDGNLSVDGNIRTNSSISIGNNVYSEQNGYFTGSLNASAFNNTSLRVLKTKIEPFTENAVSLINDINVVGYEFKRNPGEFRVGFIADDTHEYFSGEEHNQMNLGNTVGILLKAIQELSSEIELLKSKQ